jgi:hypothetical protein
MQHAGRAPDIMLGREGLASFEAFPFGWQTYQMTGWFGPQAVAAI